MPEPRTAKNRVHFDLRALATMAAEIERLEGLRATAAERFESHVIMNDPEGNVFRVQLGPDDA